MRTRKALRELVDIVEELNNNSKRLKNWVMELNDRLFAIQKYLQIDTIPHTSKYKVIKKKYEQVGKQD